MTAGTYQALSTEARTARGRAEWRLCRRSVGRVFVVVDDGVRCRKVQPLMSSVRPLDKVGRTAGGAANLEDFSVASGRVVLCATNHDPISN